MEDLMTTQLVRVKATRDFHTHQAGDELLVADSEDTRATLKAGLFELIAVEEPKEKVTPEPENPAATAPSPAPVKKKASKKTKKKGS